MLGVLLLKFKKSLLFSFFHLAHNIWIDLAMLTQKGEGSGARLGCEAVPGKNQILVASL
jgi:hypothetical protein